jgi:GNAT superfamily N-acetyltransferase
MIIKDSFEAYELPWDTEFFKVKSAAATLKATLSSSEQKELFNFASGFEFFTFKNITNDNKNNEWLGTETKAFLTDVNMQFSKQVNPSINIQNMNVFISNFFPWNEQVLHIARTSYKYSRFFNDPYLPKIESSQVYAKWTQDAFDKEDKYFVVSKSNDYVLGYLLFSINNDISTAIIELLAVNENYRGNQIGTSLINQLEMFLLQHEIKKIQVGTQLDNGAAIKFYLKNGFHYVSCSSIYHYWPQIEKRF